jgi:hypothetical protein
MNTGSWGHTLRPRPAEYTSPAWDRCSAPRCAEPSRWLATYNYVTGRAGRTSFARKLYCDLHAERFRVKHSPAENDQLNGPAPRHAVERLIDGS